MKNITFFFAFLFISPGHIFSQKFESKAPIKWGKLQSSEINLTQYGEDGEAIAVVLCDYGHIEISNRTMYNRHVRIKILKEEGLSFAKVSIPFQDKNEYEVVEFIKAQSLTPGKAGRVLTQKVKSNDIEYKPIDAYSREMVFTIPGAKVGSIIEYQYEIASLDFVSLKDWVFQHNIPTLWSEIRFDVPEPFVYMVTYQKGRALDEYEQFQFSKRLNWLRSLRWKKASRELHDENDVLYRSPDNTYVVNMVNQKRKKIVHKNLPPLSQDVPQELAVNYGPRLTFHLYQSDGNLPSMFKPLLLGAREDVENMTPTQRLRSTEFIGYIHYVLPTWAEFNKDKLASENVGLRLMKSMDYVQILDGLIESDMQSLEKADKIYNEMWARLKWNGTYTAESPRELNEVLKEGVGTSGEINMVLAYLLRRSGLKANLVMAKTRFSGRVEQVYPAHDQFNHLVVNVEIDGKNHIYDLTAPKGHRFMNQLVNNKGFMTREYNYGWIDLANPNTRKVKDPENWM